MIVLQELQDGGRHVRVTQSRADGARSYYDGAVLYTRVDARGDNLLSYIDAMGQALASAKDALILGVAGGALAKQLERRGASVTAVDIWKPALEIARRWFGLPSAVHCVKADAADFLRATGRRWDAIAIDVFQGVDIPDSMLAADMGQLISKVLVSEGRVVWNVADAPDSMPVRRILRVLQVAGLATKILSVLDGGVGNTLVIAQRGFGRPIAARPSLRPAPSKISLTMGAPCVTDSACQNEGSMIVSRPEALASARKHCRTLMSAPIPQVRAQALFATLVRAEGWTPAQQTLIVAFGEWLASRPPPSALKARCEALLAAIG